MSSRRHHEKEQREKLGRETFGLTWEQRLTVRAWPADTLAFLITMATLDGVEVAKRHGGELSKLERAGFVTIKANGQRHAVAKITRDGLSGLVSRPARAPLQPPLKLITA